METYILKMWAKLQKLSYLEKRRLFSKLVLEDYGLHCEWKIFRILVRLTFKKYKNLHKIPHPEDRHIQKLLDNLYLSPSTVVNWYYATKNKNCLEQNGGNCIGCRFCSLCEGNKNNPYPYNQIKDKYGYDLISKKLYQVLTKTEKFKSLLTVKLSNAEIRLILRRLVERDYYHRKQRPYSKEELACRKATEKMSIKPITALKWFYVIKDSKELMALARANKIGPEEVISRCMNALKQDFKDITLFGGEAA